jgi:F0F1-type ATP synthase membrane subunit b/b'
MLLRLLSGLVLTCALCGAGPAWATKQESRTAEGEAAPAAAEGGAAAPAHGGGTTGLNWFAWTGFGDAGETRVALGFMFINFVVVGVLVFIILKGPISRRVTTRRDELVKALDEANAMKAEAEKALADARAKMEMLEVEMARIREGLLSAGKAEAERIDAEASARAARMHEDASAAVQQEIARMSQEIREEMVHAVIAAAEKAVTAKINAADQARLATEYVDSFRGIEPRAPGR